MNVVALRVASGLLVAATAAMGVACTGDQPAPQPPTPTASQYAVPSPAGPRFSFLDESFCSRADLSTLVADEHDLTVEVQPPRSSNVVHSERLSDTRCSFYSHRESDDEGFNLSATLSLQVYLSPPLTLGTYIAETDFYERRGYTSEPIDGWWEEGTALTREPAASAVGSDHLRSRRHVYYGNLFVSLDIETFEAPAEEVDWEELHGAVAESILARVYEILPHGESGGG